MRESTVAGTPEIVFEEHAGDGPALLLVHGLSSNLRIWDRMLPHLSGHRVVAMDSRGHGRSGDPTDGDWSLEACARDCRRVMEHLQLADPIVVGHSWGAAVALACAIDQPDIRGVVCVDGGVIGLASMGLSWDQTYELLMPPELSGQLKDVEARVRRAAGEGFSPEVLRRALVSASDGTSAEEAGPETEVTRRTPIPEHMEIVRDLYDRDPVKSYSDIACAVLAVLASDGSQNLRAAASTAAKRMGADALSEAHPWVDVRWIDSGHDIPLEHPEALAGMISDFANQPGRRTSV